MSDEVEHYLAVYHQDSCMTTRPKPMVKSVEGVSRERWAGSKITCAEVQANYPSAGDPQPPRLGSLEQANFHRPSPSIWVDRLRATVSFFDE